MEQLANDAIARAERLGVCWNVTEWEPGFFFVYASDGDIHHALSLPYSPVVPGDSPPQSAKRFKQWVLDQFLTLQPKSQARRFDGTILKDAFHNLTSGQYADILNILDMPAWRNECEQHQVSTGRCFAVASIDSGEIEMSPIALGGFCVN